MPIDPASLPIEVEKLLRERIGSYEQLHILLLLFKSRRDWSPEELAAHVKLSTGAVSEALSALTVKNLVMLVSDLSPVSKYRYGAGAHDAAVEALVGAYQDQPIAVVRVLAQGSIERIRADALRAFSDAFLFRKGK